MTYTREMELQFQAANEAAKVADDTRRPLKNARDKALGELGSALLECPQRAGTHGAAAWAILHADYLTALLAPFVTPPAK